MIEWPDNQPIPNDLTVTFAEAISKRPDDRMISYEYARTGYVRLTVEGRREDVAPFAAEAQRIMQEWRAKKGAMRVARGACRHCGGPVPCHSELGDQRVGVKHTARSWRAARDKSGTPPAQDDAPQSREAANSGAHRRDTRGIG